MNRRKFSKLAMSSSLAPLAGCTGTSYFESDPSPEVTGRFQTEAQVVSADYPRDEVFTVTIQNTGHSGQVATALFWQIEDSAEYPPTVESRGIDGYRWERTERHFFNSGERRQIEFTGSPPPDAVGYRFVIEDATYGATIQNTGGAGNVTARIEFYDTISENNISEEETLYVDENASEEVVFNVIARADWDIDVSHPVD